MSLFMTRHATGNPVIRHPQFVISSHGGTSPLGHLYSRDRKFGPRKMFYIIFVFVTSIEGTPLFLGNEHFLWVAKPPERGGGYSTNVYERRLRPTSNPSPLLLYTIFHEKDTNFVYLLLTNGTPFVFKCCQCTVLKIGINNKNSMFSQLHKVLKFIYQPINLGPFTNPNEIFPSPFIYFNQ